MRVLLPLLGNVTNANNRIIVGRFVFYVVPLVLNDFFWLKPHSICNLYMYIQQIGVGIGCNGLGNGTH
jgi:hypothetical protein